MNTNIFVAFCLMIACAMTYFYSELREHFSPADLYKEQIATLEKKVTTERLKHLITSYESADFRSYVATLLPEAIKQKDSQEKSYQLRGLASVVQKQNNENLTISRAQAVFDEGKKYFRENKYEEASRSFRFLVKNHPYSAHIPEALFLLVESTYVLREYSDTIAYTNQMLDVYPENELTGYALLRLGKIYELQYRLEEAMDVYKTILKSFPNKEVALLAKSNLREVQL